MKKNFKLLTLVALALTVALSSCKKDPVPSPEEEKLEELKGTWNIVGASVSTDAITGVSITFTADNTTYSVTGLNTLNDANLNHSGVFEASGSFSLNDNLNVITLSPGGVLNIVSLNKDNGDLSLQYSSNYPKTEDAAQNITLTLKFAN